jgi:Golgi phosphoprotein 3 GPP34
MDELGEDLLLLAARPDGALPILPKLRFGIAGSELVRLAAARRVDIARGRIVVLDTAPTGDQLLDEALASMTGGRRGPTAKAWVARHRPGLVGRYLARAEAAGTIRAHRRRALGLFPVTRWATLDTARAARARARLEAVAASTGAVSSEQAALAGLATAIDAARVVFPGRAGAAARKRLREAAKRERGAAEVTRAAASAADASGAALHAATDAATDAATRAAVDAATRAATDAAVSAATDAAVSAAVDAATQAAVHAATDAGHGGHGGHGGAAGGHH